MCKNNDNARKIAAAARTHTTATIRNSVYGSDHEHTICHATILAYGSAGIFDVSEVTAWRTEWNHAVARGTVETTTCDDCGATIPHDLVTVLGDGDLCLCEGCKKRTCGPMTTADAEVGSDGFGDFENANVDPEFVRWSRDHADDTPDFQRGHPVELD